MQKSLEKKIVKLLELKLTKKNKTKTNSHLDWKWKKVKVDRIAGYTKGERGKR